MSNPSIPAAPPAPPAPAAAPPRNGLGTAALVLGIIGAVFALIPVIGAFVAIPLAILAVTFGAIGYVRVRKGKATNKGVTISGLVLGAAAFVLSIVMAAVAAAAVDQALSGSRAPAPQPVASAPAAADAKADKAAAKAGIGDPVTDGNLTFTVTGVDTAQTIGEDFLATEAQGKYVIVALTVKNTGDEAATFNAGPSQVAYDNQGREYETSSDAIMSANPEDTNSFLQQINPGSKVDGRLVYDVPEKTDLVKLHLQGGTFTSGVDVALR